MEEFKEKKVCPECCSILIMPDDRSAYDKMTDFQKVEVVAQQKAIQFLQNIYEGYDQDHSPLFGTTAEKLQSLDVREKIPVISDMNIYELQKLLVDFYKRNVTLDIKN